MNHRDSPPPGFVPAPLDEGFTNLIGQLYARKGVDGIHVIAFRVSERHLNLHRSAHGGMLAALADVAIGMNIMRGAEKVAAAATLNLSINFIGGCSSGDWVEAYAHFSKIEGRVRFGRCLIQVGDRAIAEAHATFYAMADHTRQSA
ncbi:PaaI family thioesterase [Mesorhizobium sp. NZP2298]|uniref:PaaI family thioesterase n=1 Tax=Mesorhizobium sp. NZP2298 TaxID=2483403 RepID=UPI001552F60B|nr:PaaI family thioesterase [Mesorhizobium sp. NZP2298]QKC98404.1 PaaI family thioesterase [Mesorhizobium sp. NZP2298]